MLKVGSEVVVRADKLRGIERSHGVVVSLNDSRALVRVERDANSFQVLAFARGDLLQKRAA